MKDKRLTETQFKILDILFRGGDINYFYEAKETMCFDARIEPVNIQKRTLNRLINEGFVIEVPENGLKAKRYVISKDGMGYYRKSIFKK